MSRTKIYKNQSYLTIRLNTMVDISAANAARILYKKPGGKAGYWVAAVINTTYVQYTFTGIELNLAGTWELQAYVEIGGLKGYGEIVKQIVDNPLG